MACIIWSRLEYSSSLPVLTKLFLIGSFLALVDTNFYIPFEFDIYSVSRFEVLL